MYKLKDWFEEASDSGEIRIATGFTSEKGLKTLLRNISEETRVRLLVGEILRRSGEGTKITEDELNDVDDTKLVCELYQSLGENISIKGLDGLHAKVYLSEENGLSGSSNLTQGGIESNIEYNTKLNSEQYHRASDWFEKKWKQGESLTGKFVREIEGSKHGAKAAETPINDPERLSRVANLPGSREDFIPDGADDLTNLSLSSQIALLDEKIVPEITGNQMKLTGDPDPETVDYLKELLIEASKRRGGNEGFQEFIYEYDYAEPDNIKRIRYVWKKLSQQGECEDLRIGNNGIAWLLEWWIESGGVSLAEAPGEVRAGEKRPILTLDLWDHQERAIDEWTDNNSNGVLEMATGTGKTAVGLAAIERACDREESADILVVAHTNAIVEQWKSRLRKRFGRTSFRGGYDIQVETVQKVTSNFDEFDESDYDLLIIDEVHHYTERGEESWGEVTKLTSDRTLGLSALVSEEKRNDIKSYIGEVVFEYSQEEAIRDGTIPEFRWLLHEVELTQEEREKYERKTKKISSLLSDLESHPYVRELARENDVSIMNFSPETFIQLQKESEDTDGAPDEWKELSTAFHERREVIYDSQNAKEATAELAQKYVDRGQDVIIFTMRKKYAEELSELIDSTQVIHSDMDDDVCEEAIERFEDSDKKVLISVKMFDEGVDIPDIDIGINAAAEKTRRQLVQRRGRILRRGGEYAPVFHQFVVKDEISHYSNLGSVEPELVEPEPVIERTLPIKVGTAYVWDMYCSLDSNKLRRVKESDDFVKDGLTGREWWLQIYFDTHEELFQKDLEDKINYDDPRQFRINLASMTNRIVDDTRLDNKEWVHSKLYSYFDEHQSEPDIGEYLTIHAFSDSGEGLEESVNVRWSSRPDLDAEKIAAYMINEMEEPSLGVQESNLVSVISGFIDERLDPPVKEEYKTELAEILIEDIDVEEAPIIEEDWRRAVDIAERRLDLDEWYGTSRRKVRDILNTRYEEEYL